MLFAITLSVDKDVIKIHYYEDVKLLSQNLIDIALKRGRCVGQSERHDLVLEIAVAGLEGRLPFVAFPDSHSMVGIS